jgi:hypothetical protein
MKTTFELPDQIFREAKSTAASEGKSIRQFFTEAIFEKLQKLKRQQSDRPWMKHCGAMKEFSDELRAIDRLLEQEFETIDIEEWG